MTPFNRKIGKSAIAVIAMAHTQQPLSQLVTQVVQHFIAQGSVKLKKGARVAQLLVKETAESPAVPYQLLGDRWLIGRSSRNCDIVLQNPMVSKIHCSIRRHPDSPHCFELQDEQSNNGVYQGEKRIQKRRLRSGDVISLGPTAMVESPQLIFQYPAPLWLTILRYGGWSLAGITGFLIALTLWEGSKVTVKPLPPGIVGPVVMVAKDGKTPLNPIQQEPHHEFQNLKDFSPYLPKAVIASEDSRFYWHFGVDPYGMARAILVNLRGNRPQGASTLTQQLARSLFPEVGRENTMGRKWREIAVALKLETVYSKDELLKAYLNRVYLGAGHYGFEDASQFYFDKSAKTLTLGEAATLVGMLPAPNLYNPVQDYDTAIQMRDRVLRRMAQLGMITEQEANRARRSRVEISPKARQSLGKIMAPYFYNYVGQELRQLLGEEIASEGNFIVETTLDPRLQTQAEKTLKTNLDSQGTQWRYRQGALVTLDTRTGEILALVGGKDYKTSQYNRATQAQRQPGSTFKIFAYTAALEKGIAPTQTFSCAPVTWNGQAFKACERSTGDVTLTQGFARSENAVALRVAQQVGLNHVMQVAERLGVTSSLTPTPGLVLGERETTVLAMTGAYGAIANQGTWNKPHAIRRILDGGDCMDFDKPQTCRVIYDAQEDAPEPQSMITPAIAQTLQGMLRQAVTNGTAQAAQTIPQSMGKTGTTNNGVDLWFIGIVPQKHWVTGIWLGNDDNRPTRGSSSQAVVLWRNYHQRLLTP